MSNAQKYMELQHAANRATDAWLEDDSEANLQAMDAADSALAQAKAAGWNIVKVADHIVDGMMERSVFGDADRARSKGNAPAVHQNARFNIVQATGNSNKYFVIDGQRMPAGYAALGAKVVSGELTRGEAIAEADRLQALADARK